MTDRLAAALAEHGESLAEILATLESLPASGWDRPWAPGKWTPAEIVEHLVLAYRGAVRDLEGGETARPRVGPGWQRALRWVLLPHILFHRSIPVRARAPREWRPNGSGLDHAGAAEALTEAAAAFERAAAEAHRAGRVLHHPYFGELDAMRTVRFAAVHLDHHRRQITRSLQPID